MCSSVELEKNIIYMLLELTLYIEILAHSNNFMN
jgi:hypothetical protein